MVSCTDIHANATELYPLSLILYILFQDLLIFFSILSENLISKLGKVFRVVEHYQCVVKSLYLHSWGRVLTVDSDNDTPTFTSPL